MKFNFEKTQKCREEIVGVLTDDALLGRSGYSMRQNTYIFPYPPSEQGYMKDLISEFINFDFPNKNVSAINVNLYDIVLDFFDSQNLWEPLCESEKNTPKNSLIVMLQDTLNASDVFKTKIEEQINDSECDLAFITGVGETFPYVRTHSLLSELHVEAPIVLVFPGEYRQSPDGSTSLDILNLPSDANGGYYRATNIFHL